MFPLVLAISSDCCKPTLLQLVPLFISAGAKPFDVGCTPSDSQNAYDMQCIQEDERAIPSTARVCTMPSATCVEWTELCPRTAAEGKRLICLTPTVHPGAFVGGVDDWFVDLFVTAIAADTLSVKPSQSTWFYYMWSNVIGPALAHIHPKFNIRTVADVGTCWRSRRDRACIVRI